MISTRQYDDGRLELWDDGSPTHLVDKFMLAFMSPEASELFHSQYERIGEEPDRHAYIYRRKP